MVSDITVLKVVAVVLTMVGLSALAELDPNNPLEEIGIPVDGEDFNIFALANQAPQIAPLTTPQFETNETRKVCWIDWFCPDLGFIDEIAKAIQQFAITVANVFIFIANIVLQVGTVTVLLVTNFVLLFNFASWTVFQGSIFLLFFGISLTAILGGSVALWIFQIVRESIPGIG